MARSRSRSRSKTSNTVTQSEATSNVTNTQGENKMANEALSMEEIGEILASGRSRGVGTDVLQTFLDSDAPGIEVDLSSGPLAGKDVGNAETTLKNARKATKTAADGSPVARNPEFGKIAIRKVNKGTKESPDYHLFLINTDLVSV